MSLSVAITLATFFITGVAIVAWYFIDLWIKAVQKTIDKNTHAIMKLREESKNLERKLDYPTLAKTVINALRLEKDFPGKSQFDSIQEQLHQTHEELGSYTKKVDTALGKIILIEDSVAGQDKKLKVMYDTLIVIHDKTKKP